MNRQRPLHIGLSAVLGLGLALPASMGLHAQTYAPSVTNPFNLTGNGSQVKPVFVDLDNDGDLDLVTATNGGPGGSMFVYYENTGTAVAPNYAAPQADPFQVPYIGGLLAPTFVDIDQDGDQDLFTGNQEGQTYFIKNRGTASSPLFNTAVPAPFGIYGIGYWSCPTFADIDNDGDFDVLIGEYYGVMYYFPNTGTATSPAFGPHQTLPFGLSNVGNAPKPLFMDMDGDGDMDLLVGLESSYLTYFQNTGTASAPAFAAPVNNPFGLDNIGSNYTAPAAGDLDGDGDLDILVAGFGNVFKYFQNTTPMPPPPAPANTTPPNNLAVCHGTPATLGAKGIPVGTLVWYDAPTGGNRLGTGSPFVTPAVTAHTVFYVQDSTGGGISASRTAVSVAVSQAVTDQTVSAAQTVFCVNGSTTVSTGSSQTGIRYVLNNNLDNTVIGPLTGTGSALVFQTGTVSATATYRIIAETTGPGSLTCQHEMPQTATVTVNQPVAASFTTILCHGASHTYADGTVAAQVTADQTHLSTLAGQAVNGCDSLVTENLVSLPALTGSVNPVLCAEESFTFNGTVYNAANPSGTEVFSNVGPNGCDSTVTVNLTLFPALTGHFTAHICTGESVNVNGTVYDAQNISGTEVFTNAGPNGCDSTVTVQLNVRPAVEITTTTVANAITADQTGTAYRWIDCATNTPVAGATGHTYTPVESGSYAVVVTDLCSDTSACVSIVTMGIKELSSEIRLGIYPNPTGGTFTVETTEPVSIRIANATGQVILIRALPAGQTSLQLDRAESGIYFMTATDHNGRTTTQRIMVIR